MIKCILFDRDGTLGNLVDKRYPQSLIPYCDIAYVFNKIKEKGYHVGVITNQSSIARKTAGNYDFNAEKTRWAAEVYEICPHDTKDNCDCRKPKSGLLYSACKKLNLLPSECIVVGDRLSDLLCASNAGAKAILVLTGYGAEEKEKCLEKFPNLTILNQFDEILNLI